MGHHVDRKAIDGDRDVGAVIRVEAAQEDLFGFAATGVLCDDETGCQPEQLLR